MSIYAFSFIMLVLIRTINSFVKKLCKEIIFFFIFYKFKIKFLFRMSKCTSVLEITVLYVFTPYFFIIFWMIKMLDIIMRKFTIILFWANDRICVLVVDIFTKFGRIFVLSNISSSI